MMNINPLQEAVKGAALEAMYYGVLGIMISLVVVSDFKPIYGLWTYPLILIGAFLFVFLTKYVPNIRAHSSLLAWRHEKYEAELKQELSIKPFRKLLKENWFTKRLEKEEKENPPSVTDYMK